jgi:hypothetical protein
MCILFYNNILVLEEVVFESNPNTNTPIVSCFSSLNAAGFGRWISAETTCYFVMRVANAFAAGRFPYWCILQRPSYFLGYTPYNMTFPDVCESDTAC